MSVFRMLVFTIMEKMCICLGGKGYALYAALFFIFRGATPSFSNGWRFPAEISGAASKARDVRGAHIYRTQAFAYQRPSLLILGPIW